MKKNRLLVALIMSMPFAVAAQGDIGELFNGSVSDAKYLGEGYLSPMMKAVGYGLNQGWYNTAKPHKIAGFDLTISANPVFIPSSEKLFNVDNSKLTNMDLTQDVSGAVTPGTGKGNIPTFFGTDKQTTFTIRESGSTVHGPEGIDLALLPVPTLHLGFGLPKGFDLKVRFIPTINLGKASNGDIDGKFGLWGVGIMHDFKQWIPGIKQLPFDLSAFAGYTKMTLNVGIEEGGANGKGEFSSAATTIQVIISKKLSVLTPYAAVGVNMGTTKLGIKGTYDFNDDGNISANERDPFSLNVKSNGPRLTGGIRLKFGPIAFHGDYTLAKYRSASVGFGINIR